MSEKLVSVLIPVYNVGKYVKEAIKSIQDQTYKNLEIIVVDDGSTDNTYNIVQGLAAEDSRIKLFRNDKNSKIVKTLNKAFKHSSGDYIARMDGDDISELDRIETLVKFVMANPKYDIVGTSMTAIDDAGSELFITTYSDSNKLLNKTLKYSSPLAHIWIAKKEVYDKLNGYRGLSGAEDYDFLLRAITAGFEITNISDYYGYKVRINRAGNTSDLMGLKQIKLHSYVWALYKQRLKNGVDNFSEETAKQVLHSNKLFELLHNKSNVYLQLAVANKEKKLKCVFFLLIALISPYQIKYLYRRFLFKLISKFINDE